ncbi:DUF3017 domain-containing protein [Streptomyces sp. O3]
MNATADPPPDPAAPSDSGSPPPKPTPRGPRPDTAQGATGGTPAAAEPGADTAPDTAPDAGRDVGPGAGPGVGGSRRFPPVTRDTARPEGGGRVAPSAAPAPARQWPMLLVLGTAGLGLLLTAFDVFRAGAVLIGAALLLGAALRWTLPAVGMLAVRSRFTDILTYGAFGVAIVLLALMAQPDPVLRIPFLDDALRFTIR